MTWRECVGAGGEIDPAAAARALFRARRARVTFDGLDNTADGSSAAWVVVGPPLPVSDLAALPVALSVDGSVVEEGVGAAASGHPARGVAWLAEQLAARGDVLEAGDLVITGGLTSARPLEPEHRIDAVFGDGSWRVEVHRAAAGPVAGRASAHLPGDGFGG